LSAAFLAIAFRSPGESFAALALPPFKPPSRPSVTAAGFFSLGAGGGTCPEIGKKSVITQDLKEKLSHNKKKEELKRDNEKMIEKKKK